MVFNSLNFIFLFLPLFLAAYFLLPVRWRNTVLLAASLVFYTVGVWKRPWCLALLLGLTLLVYMLGRLMDGQQRPVLCTLGLVILFGDLLLFKYAALFWSNAPALPLGVSFYTFQLAGYLLDVRWGRVCAERSLVRFGAGILMFPRLLSGPLTSAEALQAQLTSRTATMRTIDLGLRDFIMGLGLKVLLADPVGRIWSQVQAIGFESISMPLAWMGLISYSLQLYFDFYSYSMMAVGLGRMMGFTLPRNFAHPYAARSMSDFWRRWHISLGAWFRTYLYFPLGGNRKGKGRQLLNLLVVWLATGIWHGATANFIIWCLFLYVLLAVEKLWLGKHLIRSRIGSHVYMFFAIVLSWMIFAIPAPARILVYIGRLFPFTGGFGGAVGITDFLRLWKQYGVYLFLGVILSQPGPSRQWERIKTSALGTAVLLVLFWLAVYGIAAGLNDPFLYGAF